MLPELFRPPEVNQHTGVTTEHLVWLLSQLPQTNDGGQNVWLLTHGLAVQVLAKAYGTSYPIDREPHHDLDLVVTCQNNKDPYDRVINRFGWIEDTRDAFGSHVGMPETAWMRFLVETSYTGVPVDGVQVNCVHPAIIAIGKMAGWKPLRPKDRVDLDVLQQIMTSSDSEKSYWSCVGNQILELSRASGRIRNQWREFAGIRY